jgi:hypothetical protein
MSREIDKRQQDHDHIASSDNSGDENDPAQIEDRASNSINGTADGSRTVPADTNLPPSSATNNTPSVSGSNHLQTPANHMQNVNVLNVGMAIQPFGLSQNATGNAFGIIPLDSGLPATSVSTRSAQPGEDNHPNPNLGRNNHPNHNPIPPNAVNVAIVYQPPIQESVGDDYDDRDLVDLITPMPIV